MEGWVCQFIKQLHPENQLERDASNSRTHSCWLRKRKVHVRQGCGNLFWVFLPDIRWDCPEIHPRLGFPITFPNSSSSRRDALVGGSQGVQTLFLSPARVSASPPASPRPLPSSAPLHPFLAPRQCFAGLSTGCHSMVIGDVRKSPLNCWPHPNVVIALQ